MKRVLFLLMSVLAVAAAFTSCKKDKENAYTVKLLKTVTYYSNRYEETYNRYKFEYDKQNRIAKISDYYTRTITYDGDDLVQVVTTNNDGYIGTCQYIKNGNTITFTEKYIYNGDNYTNTYTIELDSDGLPVKQEVERSDNVNYFHVYEYQDGNLATDRITYDTSREDNTETHTYTYDNEKSALYYCQTPKWYLILYLNDFGISNNVTYSGGTYPPRSSYTYEYDVTGFPVKRTCQTSGYMQHSEGIEYFTYIKK